MERRPELDPVGGATVERRLRRASGTVLLFLAFVTCSSGSQTIPDLQRRVADLARHEHWPEVASLTEKAPRSPDMAYYRGIALAKIGRRQAAAEVFRAAHREFPHNQRFPVELAGLAFHDQDYRGAAGNLRTALVIDPRDAYANDFLATVYYLQGNLEASIKYWNRVNKPLIARVQSEPQPRLNPILLDHALAIAPASLMTGSELLTTESRLGSFGVFPSRRFDLAARDDGKFDAIFRFQERNGWGANLLQGLVGVFHRLPYQTITPEYYNIGGEAANFRSLLRWDPQKRRALASISAPLHRDAKWRYALTTDLRNENWEVRPSFTAAAPLLAALNLRKASATAAISVVENGRFAWSTGLEVSRRSFGNIAAGSTLTADLLSQGLALKQISRVDYGLLRVPERRLTIGTYGSSELARIWVQPPHTFLKLQAGIAVKWFPQMRGEDYETNLQIRAGRAFGILPFDELFVLGMERDNDLWLRAHVGTRDGKKGSAPLGRNYFVSNWETAKTIYQNGVFTFRLGPFVDTGKIQGSSSGLGVSRWLCDTGLQARLRVLGVEVAVSYGRDLRSGAGAFYSTVNP